MDTPEGAQYYLPMPNNPNVAQLFYRRIPVQMNDGTTRMALQYWSSFDCWQGSTMGDNQDWYIREKLIPVPNKPGSVEDAVG